MKHLRLCVAFFVYAGQTIYYSIQSRMTASLSLSVAYGIDVQSVNDPFVVMVEECMKTISTAGTPGAFLVDSLPIRKYLL